MSWLWLWPIVGLVVAVAFGLAVRPWPETEIDERHVHDPRRVL